MEAAVSHQGKRLKELIGAIVLSTQDIERHLKFVIPYMGTDEQEVALKLENKTKLKKYTFGQLVGAFLKNSSFDSVESREHFDQLIHVRNQLTHHFSETYGPQIQSGNIDNVISTLETHLTNINYFRDSLNLMGIQLIELLCESNVDQSPELDQLREMIKELKSSVAS